MKISGGLMMVPTAAPDLREPFLTYLEHGRLDAYRESLCESGLAWFLEMEYATLKSHLAPLSTPLRTPESDSDPARLSFLSRAMSPDATVAEMYSMHKGFLDEEDFDGAVAALKAGVAIIWNSGLCFSRMCPFYEGLKELLRWEEALEPLTRSVLHGSMAAIEFWWRGDVPMFRQSIKQAIAWAERARSNPLRLSYTCNLIHVLSVSGDLPMADVLLMETEQLSKLPGMPVVSIVSHQYMRGLIHLMRGELQQGVVIFQTINELPSFDDTPPLLWVMVRGSLIMAMAMAGDAQADTKMATRCVPEQNCIWSSFAHYCLAVVALLQGQAHKGWLHAKESMERGRLSESPLQERIAALILAQALGDMDRRDEAIGLLSEWVPKWHATGFELLAVSGTMELCNLLLRSGKTEEALTCFETAKPLMSNGAPLFVLNRDPRFAGRIKNSISEKERVFSVRDSDPLITIKTFGGLRVEAYGTPVEERQWQGQRTKTLLKLLLAHGGAEVPIEFLFDQMWPNVDARYALNAFKATLCRLRKIGCSNEGRSIEWIHVHHKRASLDMRYCAVDCVHFREMVAGALKESSVERLAKALDIYTEDFLPNVVDSFWIDKHRDRLREDFVSATLRLGELCLKSGAWETAIPYLENGLSKAPLQETLCAILMDCLEKCGFHIRALQIYSSYEKRVREELGAGPSPALVARANRIRKKTSPNGQSAGRRGLFSG
jgi:DNA-binding SARP family transcriptional activator